MGCEQCLKSNQVQEIDRGQVPFLRTVGIPVYLKAAQEWEDTFLRTIGKCVPFYACSCIHILFPLARAALLVFNLQQVLLHIL